MSPLERKVLLRTTLVGMVVTLGVILAQDRGWLAGIEAVCYDRRAKDCQFFTLPPTDRLIHLDVDDAAIDAMGRWPWPRQILAEMFTELGHAGARAVALDILFLEPQAQRLVALDDQRYTITDDDALMARAIAANGRVLIPASFPATVRLLTPPGFDDLVKALVRDPSLPPEALLARQEHHPTTTGPTAAAEQPTPSATQPADEAPTLDSALVHDYYLAARDEALLQRVRQCLDQNVTTLAQAAAMILPPEARDPTVTTPVYRALEHQWNNARAEQALERFGRGLPQGMPLFLPSREVLAPLPVFSSAATASAFVDYQPSADGTVRMVPLWEMHGLRLYPQMGLALACLYWGVDPTDPRQVEMFPDHLVIHRPAHRPAATSLTPSPLARAEPSPLGPDRVPTTASVTPPAASQAAGDDVPAGGEEASGGDVIVPIRAQAVSHPAGTFGCFFDIPWHGPTDDWLHMNSLTAGGDDTNHVSLAQVYNAIETARKLRANLRALDQALPIVLAYLSDPHLAELAQDAATPDDDAPRLRHAQAALAAATEMGWWPLAKTMSADEEKQLLADQTNPTDRANLQLFLQQLRLLPALQEQIPQLVSQLARQRTSLRLLFQDKAVLVGWTASGFTDMVRTSLHAKCPGVVIHGTVFNALMTGEMWRTAPWWMTQVLVLVLGLCTTAATVRMTPPSALVTALALAAAYWVVNGVVLFDRFNIIVGVAGPMTVIVLVWALGTMTHFMVERSQRAHITRRFSSYVDPALVNYVLEHPEQARLDGQERELTVAFTDLAGFTTLSERLREQTVPLLNRYLGEMVPIIQRHHGYVNKFLGDGIMFFHGAPRTNLDHAILCVRATLEMQEAMIDFNKDLVAQNLPTLAMRIGILTGKMVVGDAGYAGAAVAARARWKHWLPFQGGSRLRVAASGVGAGSGARSDYTVLGDVVNTASRLEGANKVTGTHILIGEATADAVRNEVLLRPVGRLQVVGKSLGLMTYEPLDIHTRASPEQEELVEVCQRLVDAFIAADWAACLAAADALERREPHSKLAALYRRQCALWSDPAAAADHGPFVGTIILESK